ncbi:MAG TPA: ATP-binding protein [Phycisphaerae bacterium]|nr:ATP-binding protein [Phycisphaerae bacterium]
MTTIRNALDKVLPSGERGLAPIGLAVLSVLVLGTILSMWWAGGAERHTLRDRRAAEIEGLNATLGEVIKPLIQHDDLAALRRVMVETRDGFHLSQCRITLPDGRVLADAEPARITAATLPARWNAPLDAQPPAAGANPDVVTAQTPVIIPGRGALELYLAAPVQFPGWATSDMQTGLSLIGAAGVGGIFVIYRRMRSRVALLEMIHEGLAAVLAGRREPDVLCLDGSFGPIANAWNQLVIERDELKKSTLSARAGDLAGSGGRGGAELESAVGALSDGVIVLGPGGKVRYANGAACVFLNLAADSLLNSSIAPHIKDARFQFAIEQVITGKERQRRVIELEQKENEGRTILRCEIRPMRRNDVDEAMIVLHDITQQRVADESRNAFVAHVTHELRTPLTNIRLYLETVAEEGENDPILRAKCLNVITQESRRLEHIVSEMLSVAEIEAGAMTLKHDDVRLDALFATLKADYAAQAQEKNVDLVFELPPKLPVLRADRERLAVALHNLLGNAVKYTPAGGTAKLAVKSTPKTLHIEVSDTGIGIDPAEHEKIFDRFYRSKDPRVHKITGTGLGLPLAREIARLHGGDITLQSQLNAGSTFILTLPAPAEAA